MSKKSENVAVETVRVYAESMKQRVLNQAKVQAFNAANEKKALKCALIFSLSDNDKLMSELQIDAKLFSEERNKEFFCLYSIEFMSQVLMLANDKETIHKINLNVFHALKTTFNLSAANFDITQDDIVAALDKKHKVKSEDKQKLISCRNDEYDSAKRQSTMCMNMLRELKIISAASRDSYKLNDNALVEKLKAKFAA